MVIEQFIINKKQFKTHQTIYWIKSVFVGLNPQPNEKPENEKHRLLLNCIRVKKGLEL